MPKSIVMRFKKIYSPTLGVIENGAIWLEQGKIKKIYKRKKFAIPKNAKVMDFSKYCAYPGFIEPHAHITISGEGSGEIGRDINEYGNFLTPHVRTRDAINLDTIELENARKEGIVAACVLPGSANLIGGMGTVIKTTCHSIVVDDAIIKDDVGLKMAFGENPKRVYSAKNKFYTRMGAMGHLRLYFQEVLNYQKKKQKEKNLKYEIGVRLLKREFPARIHAHQANDIQSAIRLAREFDFDISIEHCTDGDKIVDYLAEQKIPAVVGPIVYPGTKIESSNRNAGTPGNLAKSGILTAITTDAPVYNIIFLRYLVGIAIKGGMDYFQALNAITLNAAKICKIDDRYGDIRENIEAHFVVWDGDPLQNMLAKVVTIADQDELWPLASA